MPSKAQRTRVIGNDDEFGFRFSGATDFQRLASAVQAIGGKPLDAYESVLDWGCGCGRIARYASRGAGGGEFAGCDIDEENVTWCSDNLRGSYHRSSSYPPLPFQGASFDLVYGVSVFTHLQEQLQDAWLAELRRVIRPGGLLCVTVHGQAALDYAGLQPKGYVALRDAVARDGIFVVGRNAQLDGVTEGVGEYLNVFHAQSYVREHWSRWFSVKEILSGYVYTHDLVVLQRKLTD
jgi:SAM-dependent methyltransferase